MKTTKSNGGDFIQRHKNLLIGIAAVIIVLVALDGLKGSGPHLSSLNNLQYRGIGGASEQGISDASFAVSEKAINIGIPPIGGGSLGDIEDVDRQIIKNGSLDLVVDNTEESIDDITVIAKGNDGFVENVNVYESGKDKKRGNVTVRVPAEKFDTVFDALKDLAIKVTSENINTRDVTEEFIDIEARLKSEKEAEAQYLLVLNRAFSIEDILAVREKLTQTRQNIERYQGRLNYLSRQIDMSTISVSLTSEAEVQVFGIIWNPLTVVKQSLQAMFVGFANYVNFFIALVFVIPVLLVWGITVLAILWVLWKSARGIKRRVDRRN